MPTKDSKVHGVRILNESYDRIIKKARRRNWTFNRWMNYAVEVALRSHQRQDGKE